MNKAELEMGIKALEEVTLLITDKIELENIKLFNCTKNMEELKEQLAELNKAKTGRVRIGDDIKGGAILFYIGNNSTVRPFTYSCDGDLDNNGREFYDRASAELFALREATEFKIWCNFGGDVVIIFNNWQSGREIHNFVRFDFKDVAYVEVCNFLDTLSEEELNSIRSE